MPVTPNPKIFRFSERLFRRYEPVFRRITHNFDKPLLVKLDGSDETHINRMRDTARSFIANRFESDINVDKFTLLWANTKLTQPPTGEGVVLYDKTRHENNYRHEAELTDQALASVVGVGFSNPTKDEVNALLVLIQTGRFNEEPLRLTEVDPEVANFVRVRLTQLPNLILDEINPTDFIIL